MEQQQANVDLRDILWRVLRYRWLLLVPVVVSLCGGIIFFLVAPPVYESHVIVALADEVAVSNSMRQLVQPSQDTDTPRERVTLVNSKVRSRRFLEELVRRLGLNKDPDVRQKAMGQARKWGTVSTEEFAIRIACAQLDKQIRVTPMEGTYVRISGSGKTPEAARNLASLIADVLIDDSKRTSLQRVQARGEFSSDQITVYEERLRKAEDAYQGYQESTLAHGLTGNPVNDKNIGQAQGLARASQAEADQIRGRLESERKDWAANAGDTRPIPDLGNSRTAALDKQLAGLEQNEAFTELGDQERAKDALPGIQASIAATRQTLLAELELLAAQLPADISDESKTTAAGIVLDRIVIRSLTEKQKRIEALVNDYLRGVANSPRQDMELARLKGEVDNAREMLNTLRQEAASSRISEALETSDLGVRLSVLEPPLLPVKPTEPDPLKILGAAALLGPLMSMGIVLLGEKMAVVVRTVEQAEAELGTKVIATVPRIEGWSRPGTYWQNNWPVYTIFIVLISTGIFFTLHATVFAPAPPSTTAATDKKH
jgi:uncharacterized protein involved in exopolysaccharide biosynthesis